MPLNEWDAHAAGRPGPAAQKRATELLALEQVRDGMFRSVPIDVGRIRVFGGQLVALGVAACGRTVSPERPVHSLHAYFLRPGRPDLPIDYEVQTLREGRTLSTRRATARQDGREIFVLSASFHEPESGPAHQMPTIPEIDHDTDHTALLMDDEASRRWITTLATIFPFQLRFAEEPARVKVRRGEHAAPRQRVWLRWPALPAGDHVMHAAALAFMSDALLLSTSLLPHGRFMDDEGVAASSLDHAIWYHRDVRADEWLLYSMESSWAGSSRALCTGHLLDTEGRLVATVAQEGMLRLAADGACD